MSETLDPRRQRYRATLIVHASNLTKRTIEAKLGISDTSPSDIPQSLDDVGVIWHQRSTHGPYEPLYRHVGQILQFVDEHLNDLREFEAQQSSWRVFCGVFLAQDEDIEDGITRLPKRFYDYIDEHGIDFDIDVM